MGFAVGVLVGALLGNDVGVMLGSNEGTLLGCKAIEGIELGSEDG